MVAGLVGVGDDPDAVNLTGFLPGSGGDGALTWSLLLTGAPAGFTYVDGPGDSILVQQGGVTVLTISIDPATGEYSVVQNAAIDHAAGGDENNVEFIISYTVTDVDGDTSTGTLTVNVDDDTPINVAGQVGGLSLPTALPRCSPRAPGQRRLTDYVHWACRTLSDPSVG